MQHHPLRPRGHRRTRWTGSSIATTLMLVAVGATLAGAAVHIRLESSVPAAGEVLATVPERFELRFSGPVNDALSSIVLVTPVGDSVRIGVETSADDDRILVGDVPALVRGQHLVVWSTVSADGHPVSGEFGFAFSGMAVDADGPANAAADGMAVDRVPPLVETEPSRAEARPSEAGPPIGRVLVAGIGMLCLLGFAGILWYCGSLPLLHEPRVGRIVRALGWGALLLLALDLGRWVSAVVPPGTGLSGLTAALGTGTGLVSLARMALVGLAIAWLGRSGRVAAGLALSAVLIGAAAGHAAGISPWITMPANGIHMGAVSIWFGGLLLLVLTPNRPTDGSDAWTFGAVVRAVSAVALLSVVLIAASGMIQSALFVGDFAAFTGTTYGRGVLAKWAGLLVLIGFGAYYRLRLIPALEQDSGGHDRVFRRTVRLEAIVMLGVVMVAAWLARVSPPAGH